MLILFLHLYLLHKILIGLLTFFVWPIDKFLSLQLGNLTGI